MEVGPEAPGAIAVVGATATGKSRLAVRLAAQLGGAVVNADATALYIGMDVGTAKPSPVERAGVEHHLLDVWPVTYEATVADYQSLARAALAGLAARRRLPVLAGGSGLYVRAVLDDLSFPGTDPVLRARLEAELAARGAGALHARLRVLDPAAAASILPGNARRIVRALEVGELTGRPFPARLPGYVPGGSAGLRIVQVGLDLPLAELDARIAARVEGMWAAGFVEEVRALEGVGLRTARTASRALGYAQILRLLDGSLSEAQAREETVQATRRLARRQRSWFRRDPRIWWFDARLDVAAVVERVLELLSTGSDVFAGPGRCDGLPS